MKQKLETINSVVTLVAAIGALEPHKHRLYRGQSVDAPLLPKFAREAKRTDLQHPRLAEAQLLSSFRGLSLPYIGGVQPKDEYEWLALAQHFGLPTRLLDWTGNPLAALWFVVRSGLPSGSEAGALWILDVQDEHFIPVEADGVEMFALQRTRVFRPAHVTQRIVAQDGWFTAHWYIEKQDKFVPLEHQPRFKRHLRKLLVPKKYVSQLRRDLQALGMSNSVLFPDLQNITQDLSDAMFPPAATLGT